MKTHFEPFVELLKEVGKLSNQIKKSIGLFSLGPIARDYDIQLEELRGALNEIMMITGRDEQAAMRQFMHYKRVAINHPVRISDAHREWKRRYLEGWKRSHLLRLKYGSGKSFQAAFPDDGNKPFPNLAVRREKTNWN